MNEYIEIKKIPPPSKKGRGAFAKRNIKKGTLVEVAHLLLISKEDYEKLADTIFWSYCFEWDDPKYNGENPAAVPLSLCQFINHSYSPNLRYEYDYENLTIKYYAEQDIAKGKELTVNYNGVVDDKSPMWFEVEN